MERIPPEIVLDASVAVKWFTGERGTDSALAIRDKFFDEELEIYAPDLIVYEVANALRFKPGARAETVSAWTDDLMDMQLELIAPSGELNSRSVQLAFEHELSVYDGAYLALAELLGTKVITDDQRFYRRAKGTGLILRLAGLKV